MEIRKLQLVSPDLSRITNFYSNIIGLTLIYSDHENVEFKAGSTQLIFRKTVTANVACHFAFNVERDFFDQSFHRLRPIIQILPVSENTYIADFKTWDAEAFYFFDPDGNIVEFIHRKSLVISIKEQKNNLISISEIGIVSDDVQLLSHKLMQDYGLRIFERQKPLPDFIALGSDEGLFILVSLGRTWYPTSIQAQIPTLSVDFSFSEKNHHLSFTSHY